MIPKSDESDSVSHADRPTVEEQIELEALAGSLKIKTRMRDRIRILLIASGAGSRVTGRGLHARQRLEVAGSTKMSRYEGSAGE
jgi:hypothetical protein